MCEADGFWTSSKGEKFLPVCKPGNGRIYKRESQLTQSRWRITGRQGAPRLAEDNITPKRVLITPLHTEAASSTTHLTIFDLMIRQA